MLQPLANRSYRTYFIGTTVSAVGDGMHFIAIAWLLLQIAGTTSSIGWLLAMSSFAGIFLSPGIGVLVDRWDRRLTCMGADFFRGTTLLAIPLLFYTGMLQPLHLYIVMFLVAIGDRFYWPASGGLVREIIPVTELLAANSLSSILSQAGVLVGAGLGGLLVARFDAGLIILVNACSFFFSGICVSLVRRGILSPQRNIRLSALQSLQQGLRYLRRHPYTIGVAFLQLFLYMTLYSTNVLLPVFASRVLNVGARGFGAIDAAWAGGAILGGLSLVKMMRRIGERRYFTFGMFFLALAMLLFATSNSLPQAVIGYLCMGFTCVSARVACDTVIQSETDTAFQGRVKTTVSLMIAWVSLSVYLGIGYLGDVIPIRTIYLSLALIMLIGSLLSVLVSHMKTVASQGELLDTAS
jgi:DHA3 family macrolide efflux protein-like MFS transporter